MPNGIVYVHPGAIIYLMSTIMGGGLWSTEVVKTSGVEREGVRVITDGAYDS